MSKAIIVDDETASLEIIDNLARQYAPGLQICCTCRTIKDAIQKIRIHNPDILFLDIELTDGLSFEILEHLPEISARIIFITAYDHYALRAIKFHAFDYILKPIDPEEFKTVLQSAVSQLRENQNLPDNAALLQYLKTGRAQKIAVPFKNGLQYYDVNEIVMIKGDGSYSNMYLSSDKTILVSRKIKDFEDILAGMGFLRVHKSFLVNMDHIRELHRDDGGFLLMSNGQNVPISPKEKEDIISVIKQASFLI